MGTDVDLYEFKTTLKRLNDEDWKWMKIADDKEVALIDVDKCPDEIRAKLKEQGYRDDERVLVIIQ